MSKLVVLTIAPGDFHQGFAATLQIGEEGSVPRTCWTGHLPPLPQLPQLYQQWRSHYYELGRGVPLTSPGPQGAKASSLEGCEEVGRSLHLVIQNWFRHLEMLKLQMEILDRVQTQEPMRLVVQTQNPLLRKLPWHLWELFERRPQGAVGVDCTAHSSRAAAVSGLPRLTRDEIAETEFLENQLSAALSFPTTESTEFVGTQFLETEFAETEFAETEFSGTAFAETAFAETAFAETAFAEPELAEPEFLPETKFLGSQSAEPAFLRSPVAPTAFLGPEVVRPSPLDATAYLAPKAIASPRGATPLRPQVLPTPRCEPTPLVGEPLRGQRLQRSTGCCVNPHCPSPQHKAWQDPTCKACGMDLRLGDRYLALRCLHSDRGSEAYLAYDLQAQVEVTLLLLLSHHPADFDRFKRLGQALRALRHPGLPRIAKNGELALKLPRRPGQAMSDSLPCLVLERPSGETISALLAQHPQGLPQRSVLDWLQQSLAALQPLHQRGVFHGALGVESFVWRSGTGRWGLTQLGQWNAPDYRAPESVGAQPHRCPASDIYSLGMLAVGLLTGQDPHDLRDAKTGALPRRLMRPVRGKLLNRRLVQVLEQMVHPMAGDRPTAAALQTQLAQLQTKPATQAWSRLCWGLNQGLASVQDFQAGWANRLGHRGLSEALAHLVRASLYAGSGGAIGAGTGFALYSVGLSGLLTQNLFQGYWLLTPGAGVFALAGAGAAAGLMVSQGVEPRWHPYWVMLLAAVAYGLSWWSWHGLHPLTVGMGTRYVGSIAALLLPLAFGLSWRYGAIAIFGAIATALTLPRPLGFNLWHVGLIQLFTPTLPVAEIATPPTGLAAVIFLGGLSTVLGFWLSLGFGLSGSNLRSRSGN
jgi:hypothetical protein